MLISIIIPTHYRHKEVVNLLRSINHQEFQLSSIEVLVVSNFSDSSLKDILSKLSAEFQFHLQYLQAERLGVNSARNIGLAHASSSKILFLDDDVTLCNPKYLKTIFQYSIENPEAAAIGGRYIVSSQGGLTDKVYNHICDSWLTQGIITSNNTMALVGGNTLYNAQALGHHLKFNENIIFGGAETELNLRIHLLGKSLLIFDTLSIEHATNLDLIDFVIKGFKQGRGRAYHETVIPSYLWHRKELKSTPHQRLPIRDHGIYPWVASLYYALYEFSFRLGYRYNKRKNHLYFFYLEILICIFEELFQIDSNNDLYLYREQDALAYHLYTKPSLKLRELYHWLKGNVFWRIFNHVKWIFPRTISLITIFSIRIYHFLKAKILWKIPHSIRWFIPKITSTLVIHAIEIYHYCRKNIFWKVPHSIRWFVPRMVSIFVIHAINAYHYCKQHVFWKIPHHTKWFIINSATKTYHYCKQNAWKIPHHTKWFIIVGATNTYHYFRKNVFWRIPWIIKWRIIPGFFALIIYFLQCHFMFNTVGLSVPYFEFLNRLMSFSKSLFRK